MKPKRKRPASWAAAHGSATDWAQMAGYMFQAAVNVRGANAIGDRIADRLDKWSRMAMQQAESPNTPAHRSGANTPTT